MLLMKDVVECLKKSNKEVYFVTSLGDKLPIEEWEKRLDAFNVLNSEASGCEWHIEVTEKNKKEEIKFDHFETMKKADNE